MIIRGYLWAKLKIWLCLTLCPQLILEYHPRANLNFFKYWNKAEKQTATFGYLQNQASGFLLDLLFSLSVSSSKIHWAPFWKPFLGSSLYCCQLIRKIFKNVNFVKPLPSEASPSLMILSSLIKREMLMLH